MQWSEADRHQMRALEIGEEEVNRQLELFEKNALSLKVIRPATLDDGILQLSEGDRDKYRAWYDQNKDNYDLLKFVPASGAATRMFKHLFTWNSPESFSLVEEFKQSIFQLPFFDLLSDCFTAHGESLSAAIQNEDWERIFELILEPSGLGYGFAPKGLIPFHKYSDHIRTALEEHLIESASYASVNGKTKLHFTISKDSRQEIPLFLSKRKDLFERQLSTSFLLEYSEQLLCTDTIAVDVHNEPMRDDEGHLRFRPGGHGALIRNLSELDADLVFIKNIDNVVPEKELPMVSSFKKVLAGFLLYLVDSRERIICSLDRSENVERLRSEIQRIFQVHFAAQANLTEYELKDYLSKPIRVCGMVRNTGEPGGGPYWVLDRDGNERLQIVEKGQIDLENPTQKTAFENSTHFNPVDIVCYLRNYDGSPLDVLKFADPNAAFISTKFIEGQTIKALEHPGLWNGAMADWLTVFVEVPHQTFAPVKSINDLFRPAHQA